MRCDLMRGWLKNMENQGTNIYKNKRRKGRRRVGGSKYRIGVQLEQISFILPT